MNNKWQQTHNYQQANLKKNKTKAKLSKELEGGCVGGRESNKGGEMGQL